VNSVLHSRNIALGFVVACVALGLLGSLVASGVLVTSRTIRISGVLASANLGVYSDSACMQSLASVDWGSVSLGGTVSRTVYVKNLGTSQVVLSLTKSNWSPPSANGPVTVSWNREGATLNAGQVASATLTLSVSSSASGFTSFSVDAVITGTG